jgi:hypothetical protein
MDKVESIDDFHEAIQLFPACDAYNIYNINVVEAWSMVIFRQLMTNSEKMDRLAALAEKSHHQELYQLFQQAKLTCKLINVTLLDHGFCKNLSNLILSYV